MNGKEVTDAENRAGRRSSGPRRRDRQGRVAATAAGGAPTASEGTPLAAHSRPRLKPGVEAFPSGDGCLYLLRPGGEDLMVRDAPATAVRLLARLDGSRTCAELGEGEVVGQLWRLGFLEDAALDSDRRLEPAARARYERQLAYFAELAPPGVHRGELQARLAGARVAVIGLGGLGCWTAYGLACAGVGELVVVDGDRVETANLNRQVLYTPADVGRSKAAAGAGALRRFNPLVSVEPVARRLEGPAEVEEVTAGADALLELADWPVGELSKWAARVSHRLGVPHLQASQDPPLLRVGPTFLPGRTGCAECLTARHRERHRLYDELAAFRARRTEETATFGPACAIVGGVLANEVVNLLLGLAPPATAGRAATLDLRTLEWTWDQPIEPRPDCPACGSGP
jgi:molybdopterin-synthase adenylyltransferase